MSKKKKQKLDVTPYEDREQLCPHFGLCGGCTYQKISYEKQMEIKAKEVEGLLRSVYPDFLFEGIIPSPSETGYRNKMEFTFGDTCKDGPFALGLHQKGSFMNIVDIRECILVHPDMNLIRNAVRDFFAGLYESGQIDFKNNKTQRGYLRHLLLRRAAKNGEILVALVTTSPGKSQVPEFASIKDRNEILKDTPKLSENPYEEHVLYGFLKTVWGLEEKGALKGKIAGILHITNDAVSDVVKSDRTDILYGGEAINEEVLGLKFQISPFSFFQTNTLGAEKLYEKAREYAAEAGIKAGGKKTGILFDLYSGTGTIAQLMAPAAEKVIGVEIVEEAVEAAKENAKRNEIENVSFIAGDVLKVLDELPKPDAIILDPPREGINPKALGKILSYGVDSIVYVSCKPTSLARDLESFRIAGYTLVKACCKDMFPQTPHCETVALITKQKQ
ncbi:MAG: class I SAM-dependent RNA methyltransferase [Lachnospiraceae bacterium]|nr:class I SAM-dependent RNA methyltransferase [Lachnospiraceae bacterium]